MNLRSLRLVAVGAIAAVGIPLGGVVMAASPAGAADLTSCSISPSNAVWNATNVEPITLSGTPADGQTVQVLWVKSGDSWTVVQSNEFPFTSVTFPQPGQEAATYASFLSLVGGTEGEVKVGYFPVGTTDFTGTPLCSVIIAASAAPAPTTTTTTTTTTAPATTTTAPKTVLAATGSDSEGMILLGAMTALLGAGAVVVSRRRRSHASS